MKNSTLFLLGAFLFSGVANAQQRFVKTNVKKDKVETVYLHPKMNKVQLSPAKSIIKKSETNAIWKPLVETAYEYAENGWAEYATMD